MLNFGKLNQQVSLENTMRTNALIGCSLDFWLNFEIVFCLHYHNKSYETTYFKKKFGPQYGVIKETSSKNYTSGIKFYIGKSIC